MIKTRFEDFLVSLWWSNPWNEILHC